MCDVLTVMPGARGHARGHVRCVSNAKAASAPLVRPPALRTTGGCTPRNVWCSRARPGVARRAADFEGGERDVDRRGRWDFVTGEGVRFTVLRWGGHHTTATLRRGLPEDGTLCRGRTVMLGLRGAARIADICSTARVRRPAWTAICVGRCGRGNE